MRIRAAFAPVSLTSAILLAAACGSTGAQGPAGPAGEAGAPGPAGEAGPPGTSGTNGEAGATGTQGPPGAGAEGGSVSDGGAGLEIVLLSARAQQGFAIAPPGVSGLSLAGKTPAQLEQIGLGSYIVNAQASCGDCHNSQPGPEGGAPQYLAGGLHLPTDGAGHYVVARNLTPDSLTGLKDTEAQFIQAQQNGTDILNGSTGLQQHPWQYYRWMSTDDLKAIYAYLKVIPAVSNAYDSDNKVASSGVTFPCDDAGVCTYDEGAVNRTLPATTDVMGNPLTDPNDVMRGLAIDPVNATPPTDATTQSQFARGSYLVNAVIGCSNCHTNPSRSSTTQAVNTAMFLSGGAVFPTGPAAPVFRVTRSMTANLIGQTHGFFNQPGISFDVFLQTITQGVHADTTGTPPLAYPMPWFNFKKMTLDDLQAIYTYLRTLAQSSAAPSGANDKITESAARYCASGPDCLSGETCDSTAHECIGRTCAVDTDCDACQTCTSTHCAAPAASSTCVFAGF